MFNYEGGNVTRKQLEEAFDLFVQIEMDYKESVRKATLNGETPPL